MKKIIMGLILIFLTIGISAYADSAVAGHIYSTDILAFVNGKPIEGYNIGGKTVVIAEDLVDYGFTYQYNDESRVLKIMSYFNRGNEENREIPRGSVGKILGNVYETDIKVYYNGILLPGYNIGGRTAICIEELGDISDSPNRDYGYSKYLGKSIWDPENKTISFESYLRNEEEILGVSRVYHRFKDNVIYTFSDDYCAKSEFSAAESEEFAGTYTYSQGTGLSKYLIKPLFFDNHGELLKIGLCVANPNNTYDEPLMFIEDPEVLINLIKTFKSPQKSHDDAVAYFSGQGEVVEKIQNKDYTVLMIKHKADGLLIVYVNRQGGFVVQDFCRDFGDRTVKIWFEEEANTVIHSIYPYGGPHGTVTAHFSSDLDEYDYE